MDNKNFIAKRVAMMLSDGDVVNLGIGVPQLVANHIPEGITFQFSAANLRFKPGAILSALYAASIRIVPLPQNGSQTMLSPLTWARSTIPAARVSLIGAALEFLL